LRGDISSGERGFDILTELSTTSWQGLGVNRC
jgi:hypothetical protein